MCYCYIKLTKSGLILRNSDVLSTWHDRLTDGPSLRVLGYQLICAILHLSIAYWPAVTQICPLLQSRFTIIVLLSARQSNDAFPGLKSGWIELVEADGVENLVQLQRAEWWRPWKGRDELQTSGSAWKRHLTEPLPGQTIIEISFISEVCRS